MAVITRTIWICPYCDHEFSDEDDAEECAKECCLQEKEEVREEQKIIYVCLYCNKRFKTEKQAAQCEEKHVKNEDLHFAKYVDEENKAKLLKAANVPGQKKLIKEEV